MTTAKTRRPSPRAKAEPALRRRHRFASIARRVTGIMRSAGTSAVTLVGYVPATVRATRAGAQDTTIALQTLPDSTLQWLAAGSVGLSAGLRLARAPRLVVAAGALPALLAGAAIALRPVEPNPTSTGD